MNEQKQNIQGDSMNETLDTTHWFPTVFMAARELARIVEVYDLHSVIDDQFVDRKNDANWGEVVADAHLLQLAAAQILAEVPADAPADSYWHCDRAVAPPVGANDEPMWLVWAAEGEDYPVLIGQFARYEDAERIVALHNAGRVKPTLPADDGADTRPIPF